MSKRRPKWKPDRGAHLRGLNVMRFKCDGGDAQLMKVKHGPRPLWAYVGGGDVDPYDDCRMSHTLTTLYGAKMAAEYKARGRMGWRQ